MRLHTAPNGVSIDAHSKFSATEAMEEHIKATEGDIPRCEERTAHIWKLAQQAPNDTLEDDGNIITAKTYYGKMGYGSLEKQATNVLHYKNGSLPKAKTLFRLWWKSALKDYERGNASDARFKSNHPEEWTAAQKIQINSLLRMAAMHEQQAKDCYAEAKELGADLPTDVSPERIKELKSIMQANHPDRGGDEDVFRAAAKELAAIRAGL